ncbi:hypothetical protein EDB19DRAFT_1797411 [Suillus lakei]|nr:hypothetical protein EDB19DRAFT_1797411 [Suillus lakei]
MSQTPHLLACFLMPVSLTLRCLLPMDDIGHSSQPHIQAKHTMYTSTLHIDCYVILRPPLITRPYLQQPQFHGNTGPFKYSYFPASISFQCSR